MTGEWRGYGVRRRQALVCMTLMVTSLSTLIIRREEGHSRDLAGKRSAKYNPRPNCPPFRLPLRLRAGTTGSSEPGESGKTHDTGPRRSSQSRRGAEEGETDDEILDFGGGDEG
eukprot:602777-Amorphochlora_amoeboformis.AAC.1